MSADGGVGPTRIGIDFGTSSTVAVAAPPGREPRPLIFDGSPLLPSAVCVGPTGHILTGRDALHTGMADPSGFDPHPKQRIDTDSVLLAGSDVPVSKLIQAVLGRVLAEAANVTGGSTDHAPEVVLTCPAGWGSVRRAVLLAAAPRGTRLVEEPIAAAHYFVDIAGSQLPDGGTAVVYDFGAGTFDAAVVRRTGPSFTTIASRGAADCGGLDIDAAIVEHLRSASADQDGWARLQNPTTVAERRARQQLWDNVRAGKEMLSRTTSTLVHLPLLDTEAPLGREELERLAAPVLDRTLATVRDVLDAAGVRAADLSAIFLSGGSSRMPAVVTRLHRAFGIPPATVDQPEFAVAEGSLRVPTGPRPDAPADDRPRSATSGPESLPHQLTAGQPLAGGTGAGWRISGRMATRRRVALVGVAAVAVLGIAVTVAVGALRDDRPDPGGPSPLAAGASPSTAGSPTGAPSTYPPGVEPCLVGTWRVISNQAYGLIDDVRVLYTGGGGTLITYRPDGTWHADYNKMKPRTTKYAGATWSDVYRGTASGRYHAENGVLTATTTRSTIVDTLRRNGKVNATSKGSNFPEPANYRCAGKDLYTYSPHGNYSNQMVRVSSPPT